MLIQLAIAVPIAYVLAYKAGRWELPLLLFLVLADELNPMVRIYAWRMLLGREGLINEGLQRLGLIDQPIDALLFSKFAVIVVLSTSYLTYTVIPIYAAMKAVDRNLFEAARDLGAGWWTTTRRVLLPLIAPGIFVALLLVYIPLFTDFASPTLVGGTSGYMLGQVVNDLVLESGDLNGGAAMSLLMLFASGDLRRDRLPAGEDQAAGDHERAPASAYDAAIVGGGHNGLVAAHYLATAGLRTIVLERREIVGGCCVTEEFAPGFRASTGAYVLSMLREPVWRDLRLVERGIVVDPAGPSLNLFEDGSTPADLATTSPRRRASSRASRPPTPRALPGFEAELAEIAELITPLIDTTPPDPPRIRARELGGSPGSACAPRATARGSPTRSSSSAPRRPSTCPSTSSPSRCWRRSAGTRSTTRSRGPSTPGTAYVLLHDHAAEQAGGGIRQWGFVRGGIGRVTEAMADSAREAGADVRTEAQVARVLIEGRSRGRASCSPSGEEIRAARVLSNADPKTTFLDLVGAEALPERFAAARARLPLRGHEREDQPRGRPSCRAPPRSTATACSPTTAGSSRSIRGWPRWTRRRPRRAPDARPPTPTSSSASRPSTIRRWRRRASTWSRSTSTPSPTRSPRAPGTSFATPVADRAIAKLGAYFPNLPDSIIERQVLAPPDLEALLGIWGGHALHGDMAFDQLFNLRPVRGWADYRTPVEGLWLCGAGTHPGGGVTGANGRNCAREVLRDARRGARSRLRGLRR